MTLAVKPLLQMLTATLQLTLTIPIKTKAITATVNNFYIIRFQSNRFQSQSNWLEAQHICFGTIRNSTALKPRGPIFLTKSRNRAICLSQTSVSNSSIMLVLLYLKNLDFSTFLNNLKTYSCNFFLQIFC